MRSVNPQGRSPSAPQKSARADPAAASARASINTGRAMAHQALGHAKRVRDWGVFECVILVSGY